MQLTGADVDLLIPDDPHSNLLKSTCINCHALDVMLRRRGYTAAQWRAYVETPMAERIGRGKFNASEAEWKVLTSELERWFGPKGQYFGPECRAAEARAAAASEARRRRSSRATFQEYRLPNPRSMPHSLTVDANGQVWIAGWDSATNAVLRFDPRGREVPHVSGPDRERCAPHAVHHAGMDGCGWRSTPAAWRRSR